MCITASFLKLKVRGGNSKQSFSKEEFYQKAGETVAMAQLDPESSGVLKKTALKPIKVNMTRKSTILKVHDVTYFFQN